MSKHISFVPTTPTHIPRFSLLMKALRERGDEINVFDVDPVLPHYERIGDQINNTDFPVITLHKQDWDLNPEAPWWKNIGEQQTLITEIQDILQRNKLDLLIISSLFGPARRSIIRAGNKSGVPTIYIPDGLLISLNPRRKNGRNSQKANLRHNLSVLARRLNLSPNQGNSGIAAALVMNQMSKDYLIRCGLHSDIIHVVGCPEYDRLAIAARTWKGNHFDKVLREKLGIEASQRIVLYAAQEDIDHRQPILDMAHAARQCNAILVVKFHPRSRSDFAAWRLWSSRHRIPEKDILFLKDQISSIDALRICSVCVTVFSTITLEAMILGKPIVLAQYLATDVAIPYGANYAAVLDAESPMELQKHIISLLTDDRLAARLNDRARKALDKELLGLDGRSIDRMIAIIDGLTSLKHSEQDKKHIWFGLPY